MKSLLFWFGVTTLFAAIGSMHASDTESSFRSRIAEIERTNGGRLGVAVWDNGSGLRLDYRGDERFALCSTFKMLLAGAILARVDAGTETLERRISYRRSDLVLHSPRTASRVEDGSMSVADLCAAAVEAGDNTAANLLLAAVGGPAGLTRFLRALGDPVTRVDRIEPEMNSSEQGDERDTTTPNAMASAMTRLLCGDRLLPDSRDRLERWMIASTTGLNRLRAGFRGPARIGDRTGNGPHATTNDVAIVRWPGRSPALVTVYYTGSERRLPERERVIAEVARVVDLMLRNEG